MKLLGAFFASSQIRGLIVAVIRVGLALTLAGCDLLDDPHNNGTTAIIATLRSVNNQRYATLLTDPGYQDPAEVEDLLARFGVAKPSYWLTQIRKRKMRLWYNPNPARIEDIMILVDADFVVVFHCEGGDYQMKK